MEAGDVCRLCLKEGAPALSNGLSQNLLQQALPEIKHKIRGPLALCGQCSGTLVAFCELRKTARMVEEAIRWHMVKTGMEIVDLREVKQRRFSCETCRVCFFDATLYEAHLSTHSLEKRFQCLECGKSFSTNNNLQKHHRYVHRNFDGSTCSDATTVTTAASSTTSNSGCVVTSGTYKCGVCHRKFPTEQILKEHRSRAHLEKGKHVCKNCQATFSSLNSKRRHTLICFGLAEQIICLKCGRTFSSNWNLKRHCQLLHERKKEPKQQQIKTCKFCGFNCKESHMMVKHLKELHNVSITCPICCKIFTQTFNRNRHLLKTHTAEEREQLTKKTECNDCDKDIT